MDVLEKIRHIGIVPVVKLDSASDAPALAKALIDGGLACAEITFRTEAAEASIRSISQAYPDMFVGAGTVLTPAQLDKAINAGAKFVVSPGFNPEIVKACMARGVPVYPGCSTPTDMEAAMALGLSTVKFFPAENAGGIAAIKAMAGPYTGLSFIPTGGINAKNINDYLRFPKVVACGGSWMVDPALILAGNFGEITRRTRQAVNTVLGFSLSLENLIGAGNNGAPVVVGTNYLHRALYQFAQMGYAHENNVVHLNGLSIRLVQK